MPSIHNEVKVETENKQHLSFPRVWPKCPPNTALILSATAKLYQILWWWSIAVYCAYQRCYLYSNRRDFDLEHFGEAGTDCPVFEPTVFLSNLSTSFHINQFPICAMMTDPYFLRPTYGGCLVTSKPMALLAPFSPPAPKPRKDAPRPRPSKPTNPWLQVFPKSRCNF